MVDKRVRERFERISELFGEICARVGQTELRAILEALAEQAFAERFQDGLRTT